MQKNRHVLQDRAMRNAWDSDTRCGLAAGDANLKSLAMWVERCEPLSPTRSIPAPTPCQSTPLKFHGCGLTLRTCPLGGKSVSGLHPEIGHKWLNTRFWPRKMGENDPKYRNKKNTFDLLAIFCPFVLFLGHFSQFFSAAPQQSEICVKFSVFHTVFDVKFWRNFPSHTQTLENVARKISPKFHAKFHDTFGREKRRKFLLPHFCRVAFPQFSR